MPPPNRWNWSIIKFFFLVGLKMFKCLCLLCLFDRITEQRWTLEASVTKDEKLLCMNMIGQPSIKKQINDGIRSKVIAVHASRWIPCCPRSSSCRGSARIDGEVPEHLESEYERGPNVWVRVLVLYISIFLSFHLVDFVKVGLLVLEGNELTSCH